jgi:hypothetical protein
MKVVHLFMEHIFHNWRHFKFEVEMVQKSGQSSETPLDRREKMPFWQEFLGQTKIQITCRPLAIL